MKASELRIGNFVQWFNDIITLDGVTDSYVTCDVPYWEVINPEQITAIPLTSEWLEKFGFRQQGDRKMWVRDKVAVVWHEGHMFNEDGYYVAFKDMGNVIYHTQCRVDFVHQLQNAYFVTGEELTIKE